MKSHDVFQFLVHVEKRAWDHPPRQVRWSWWSRITMQSVVCRVPLCKGIILDFERLFQLRTSNVYNHIDLLQTQSPQTNPFASEWGKSFHTSSLARILHHDCRVSAHGSSTADVIRNKLTEVAFAIDSEGELIGANRRRLTRFARFIVRRNCFRKKNEQHSSILNTMPLRQRLQPLPMLPPCDAQNGRCPRNNGGTEGTQS